MKANAQRHRQPNHANVNRSREKTKKVVGEPTSLPRRIEPYLSGPLHCLLDYVLAFADDRRVSQVRELLDEAHAATFAPNRAGEDLGIRITPIEAVIRNTLYTSHEVKAKRLHDPFQSGALHSSLELAIASHPEGALVELVNLLTAPVPVSPVKTRKR